MTGEDKARIKQLKERICVDADTTSRTTRVQTPTLVADIRGPAALHVGDIAGGAHTPPPTCTEIGSPDPTLCQRVGCSRCRKFGMTADCNIRVQLRRQFAAR
jgi:hypothetical protein